jgi:histidinol-phosphatase (PHP family)
MPVVSWRLVDYHVHSTQSVDGRSSVDEICSRAVELKLEEIGFCEHVDFEPDDPGFGFFDYRRYSEAIDRAGARYADRLTIRKGAEIDYSLESENQIRTWLEDKDFDFLVGSIHYVDHIALDLGKEIDIPPRAVVSKYYTKVRQAAESRLFNVIGHFDFIRSYIPSGYDLASIASDIIDRAFERMVSNGVHLEINSRRKLDRDPFPSRRLILQYLDKGGELFSFGSDAHSTRSLGVGIRQSMDLLRSLRPKAVHLPFE